MSMAKCNNHKGQSTIEFLMTFTAAVGFIFLFLKMAMNYTDGFMVHHATYMASRAYLVNDDNRDLIEEDDAAALKQAKLVFTHNLPEGLVPGVTASMLQENNPGQVKFSAFVGLYIRYQEKFSIGFVGGKTPLNLVSESFLGREPTRREARNQVCMAMKLSLGLSKCAVHVTLEDNGG
jgi:hypothetical protein